MPTRIEWLGEGGLEMGGGGQETEEGETEEDKIRRGREEE